ncbi:MAG TPA: ABC transporter transmembrane domain-containing protein, partial [Thermoanaerobaculia bacterium]|nr:ABC transporter transmembrane domain-containing protein [Thermoanaerobaculia bacterium]
MSEPESHHEEEVLGKAYDARLMRRLLAYLRPYKGMAAGSLALILVSSVLQLVGPLAAAVAFDLFISPVAPGGEVSQAAVWVREALAARGLEAAELGVRGLAAVALVYLATLLLTFVLLYGQSYLMQLMGQYIMRDLRREIFDHLQRLPVSYFDRNPIGRLVTRVTTDVDALNELFTAGLVAMFGDIAVLFGIVGVLFWLDWRLALVAFAIVPLLVLLTSWFKARVRDSFRDVRVKIARINAFLQEHVTGMSVLQLFGREAAAYREFEDINRAHRDANVRSIFYYAVFYPGVELITALGMGLLLWYGGGRVLVGALSLGGLIAFLQYAQRFYQPLADLSEKYNILQGAMASSERIFRLLDTPAGIVTPPAPYRPERVAGAIELDDVWFGYKADEPVLKGVSFRVQPGETLAVVGHTGAGKSTLANLLLRFYDVDAGTVRVDGVDVRQWDLAALRRGIALVLQDV